MGLNLKKIGTAAATGGLSLVADKLKPSYSTQTQSALETPEQSEMRKLLAEFGRTGKFGDFDAGAQVPMGYGDFSPTGVETQAMGGLQNLLSSGIPDQFRMGDDALRGLLTTDPGQIEAQFNPFKTQVERQIRDSNTALKRNAAFTGNLYSTNTVKRLGDIEARGNETLTSELARLTNEALNRRERAIPLAYQSGAAQENVTQNRLGSAFQYGGLTRQLNDQSIKARDAEIQRRRAELQLPIQAAQNVTGSNVQFGVPSVKVAEQSPYLDILKLLVQGGGRAAGAGG